jgi:hypothetical protein
MIRLAGKVRQESLVELRHYRRRRFDQQPRRDAFLIANARLEFNAKPKESTD